MDKKRGYALKIVCLLISCLYNPYVECHISAEPPARARVPRFKDKFQTIVLSILLGVVTGLALALLFASLVRCITNYLKKTPILKGHVIFSPKIAPNTLQSALANENQLLGSSSNGNYYKTVLDNGLTIAVKRLEPFQTGSPEFQRKMVKRQIQGELERLASLRHRNLMSLRAYVRESDRFCLVYDYVATGSLADAMNRMRGNQLQLSWDLRLKIAVGIIKGLQYLHFSCTPRVLHYNLKPSNVMLDAEFEPRLGDCGLAKLMPNLDRASSGYHAPECFPNFSMYTDRSDIYSFGAILGLLLTGRDPMDPFFGEAGSLGEWLRHLQEVGEARDALDKSIIGEEMEEDEMVMAVRIAAVCLSDVPTDRPCSEELVPMLTQLHSF